MKLAVVALDYDGTVTDAAGQLHGSVRNAIAELRSRGITVLFVTGRRLEQRYQLGPGVAVNDELLHLIRERYMCEAQDPYLASVG